MRDVFKKITVQPSGEEKYLVAVPTLNSGYMLYSTADPLKFDARQTRALIDVMMFLTPEDAFAAGEAIASGS